MSRRDDLDHLYEQSNTLQNMALFFFWVNMIVGVASAFLPSEDIYLKIEGITQGISAALFLALTLFDDCICWYNAEAERRKTDVENAFGVTLGELTTQEYYNNSLPSSISKFALNAMESSFFSKHIAQKMVVKSCIKALFAIIVMIVSAFVVSDPSTLLIIIQAALTTYFIEDAVKLLRYINLVKSIYDALFKSFITIGISNKEQETNAFMSALEYETVKAHFKIRLDSKVFEKSNEMLSGKWNELLKQVRVPLYSERGEQE